ncbi:telomere zinc finger-associated protein-like [Neocloeon triangulifer]|uniref:telomere zinc finger-associated protein-like n=1 Tax=Neocloeon triangulifer TaxID=2078957 RepID=UPI00286F2949|nr:telomere zinc finger-associated protein-like [Neocloeon triangulifer]
MFAQLCRLCERPAAEGGYRGAEIDFEALAEWCLNYLGTTLAQEVKDDDLFCHFCVWDARFLIAMEAKESNADTELNYLCWWPVESTESSLHGPLFKGYEGGKLKQCWVTLNKVKLKLSESKQSEQAENLIDEVGEENLEEKCRYCEEFFPQDQPRLLTTHVNLKHRNIAIRCNFDRFCTKYFDTKAERDVHVKTYHKKPPVPKKRDCIFCPIGGLTKGELSAHVKLEHIEVAIPCKSKLCSEYFRNRTELINHVELYHPRLEMIKHHKCSFCDFKTTVKVHLANHEAVQHKKIQLTKCQICSTNFISKLKYLSHFKTQHRLSVCQFCGSKMRSGNHLLEHACRRCNAKFECFGLLEKHGSVCEMKLFKCDLCPKVCKEKWAIKAHIVSHLNKQVKELKVKPTEHQCKICNRYYSGAYQLWQHVQRSHPALRCTFSCAHCEKEFLTKVSLKSHLALFHKLIARRHRCRKCSMKFFTRSDKNQHIELKHNWEDVECTHCKKVIRKKNLRAHLAYAHNLIE